MSLQKTNLCHFHKEGAKIEVSKKCYYYVLSQCNEFFSNGAVSFSHENAGNAGALH